MREEEADFRNCPKVRFCRFPSCARRRRIYISMDFSDFYCILNFMDKNLYYYLLFASRNLVIYFICRMEIKLVVVLTETLNLYILLANMGFLSMVVLVTFLLLVTVSSFSIRGVQSYRQLRLTTMMSNRLPLVAGILI